MFLFLSILSGIISYINMDPMKSSFFLIFSLLFSMPLVSMSMHIWFSYFICLLFLSGIFVILVYFSSLSKINVTKSYLSFLCFFLSLLFVGYFFIFDVKFLSLTGFYYSVYWLVFGFILLVLIFFYKF